MIKNVELQRIAQSCIFTCLESIGLRKRYTPTIMMQSEVDCDFTFDLDEVECALLRLGHLVFRVGVSVSLV